MTDLNLADWMERRRRSLDAHADHIIASVREYEAALSTRAPDPRVQALVDALEFYAGPHINPNDGPWGLDSHDYGATAAVALMHWRDGE